MQDLEPTVVTPSRWLADRARESSLLADYPVEVIPYGLDLETYCPRDASRCRRELGLPEEVLLVAFGAVAPDADPRKGVAHLRAALERIAASGERDRIETVLFGSPSGGDGDTAVPIHRLGFLETDEEVARAYGAADLFVAPSLEDNLPNTLLEALACGIPVVAFEVGGIPEIVSHGEEGLLVSVGDDEALAEAILRVAEADDRRRAMGRAARRKAEEAYGRERQAIRYRELYGRAVE